MRAATAPAVQADITAPLLSPAALTWPVSALKIVRIKLNFTIGSELAAQQWFGVMLTGTEVSLHQISTDH